MKKSSRITSVRIKNGKLQMKTGAGPRYFVETLTKIRKSFVRVSRSHFLISRNKAAFLNVLPSRQQIINIVD